MTRHYDLAILGGGLAGLSALYHLEKAGKLAGKRIALVDPEGRKSGHDRSWSFWENTPGPFEHLVYHRWPRVTVHNLEKSLDCDLGDYEYKFIRSTEFYDYVNEVLDGVAGLERIQAKADEVVSTPKGVTFKVKGQTYSADLAFSSLPLHLRPRQIKQPYLDQHFRGWFIHTEEDVFDPEVAALMDFRTPQNGEPRFFYVLPTSARRAMVEIAIFSNNHLVTEEYDRLIADYLRDYWTTAPYTIEHTEGGNIPMTTYPFVEREHNLIYIGMRGGATRPSTGYTFYGLQRQLKKITATFPNLGNISPWPRRHILYDATLLRILQDRRLPGDEVFVDLFDTNPPERLLAFLNGETSLGQEINIMSSTY
ncbi:MAG: lycopene cyclase family protein, partial [Bacteroidota bacterium]